MCDGSSSVRQNRWRFRLHHEITSKLGESGMGAVYRATNTRLNRDVVDV
jgi:hypothetical protein